MTRWLYRCLIGLHPAAFRRQFAGVADLARLQRGDHGGFVDQRAPRGIDENDATLHRTGFRLVWESRRRVMRPLRE